LNTSSVIPFKLQESIGTASEQVAEATRPEGIGDSEKDDRRAESTKPHPGSGLRVSVPVNCGSIAVAPA
jgi:hypothetical protein